MTLFLCPIDLDLIDLDLLQTYTFEELSEAFSALIQQRHSEIRDAGKEITKLLSSSNRVLKVCVYTCVLVSMHLLACHVFGGLR